MEFYLHDREVMEYISPSSFTVIFLRRLGVTPTQKWIGLGQLNQLILLLTNFRRSYGEVFVGEGKLSK